MESVVNRKFYSGTSGLVLPVPNKQHFPIKFQDKSRLNYYSSLFNSIEINSTFYKVPKAATICKWANDVPEDFRFTFKLWQGITHNKGLVFNPFDVDDFIKIINNVGLKRGCLLIQLPPAIKVEAIYQVEKLLSLIRLNDPELTWDTVVEFRHKSWYQEKAYNLLDKYFMGMVIHDLPAPAAPVIETKVNFIYLRFHGPTGGYRGSYTEDVLTEYNDLIMSWLSDNKIVYAYFNNTIGAASENLVKLNDLANMQFN